MTPEQLKLIQQLAILGDVTIFNRKKETVIRAITEMDIVTLELILDENLTYQDASKEIFLNKLKVIFDEFKRNKDTLVSHSGKCGSKECKNHDKNGMLFCGRKTGHHFNLIIEEDENHNVKDLFYCYEFKCNFENKSNTIGKSINIEIYKDELANFYPNSNYSYINSTSLKAISDLSNFKNKVISKKELLDWHEENKNIFYNLSPLPKYRFKNEHKFYNIYNRVNELKEFLTLEEDCEKAMQIYDTLLEGYELNLLKWLSEHEHLKNDLMLLCPDFVDENTGLVKKIIVNKELNISINIDCLKNCIRFQDIIDKQYYVLFNKYKVEIEEKDVFPLSEEEIEKHISLKYHLQKRNFFINEFNYKIKLGKNSFLYDADNFGVLDK